MKVFRKRIRNADGEILRGDFHVALGSNDLVVVCHGFGKTWNKNRPLFRAICAAFQAGGVNAFRFSFSGLSPSGGKAENSSYSKQKADLSAVIDYFTLKVQSRSIALVAHSFGSVAAVLQAASDNRIQQLLLVAPRLEPRRSIITKSIEEYCGKKLDEIIASDTQSFPVGPIIIGGIEYWFSRKYVEDLLHTDVLTTVTKIRIPITIIRGDNDKRISEEEMLEAVKRNPLVSYVRLADTGHSFGSQAQRKSLCSALLNAYNPHPFKNPG
ncbi:MAG TPA: alpha/beta hydrolase [Dissulfurispiraceae bacterium]|nr:alpha/beta hydrolase [Dissulfurispiraceae bacterium]